MDLGYILEVELINFVGVLGMGGKGKRGLKNIFQVLGLSSWVGYGMLLVEVEKIGREVCWGASGN